ncbi:MAG: beta-1,3-glucanase family protein [Casimicrobiaceae bacterium]
MGFAATLLAAPVADAAVTLLINNQSGQPVCAMWTGQTNGLTGSNNNINIATSDFGVNASGFPLSNFTPTTPTSNIYQISNFTMGGGRMWFTYGANCWAPQSTGYNPALANFNDPNFTLRYDKIEAFITGSTDDNLDITAVDAFSIPFSVKAYVAANPSGTTQKLKGSPGTPVMTALAAIAADAKATTPITPSGGTPPLTQISGNSPYLVINANSQGIATTGAYQYSPYGTSGAFVRIIANDNRVATYAGDLIAAANGNQVPNNYNWMTYNNYLKRMDGRAASPYTGATTLAGNFAGVGGPTFSSNATSPQSYNLTATFNPMETRNVTYTVPGTGAGTGPYTITFTGFVTLSGTSTIASGTYAGTYTVEIKIPYGSLPEYMSIPAPFVSPYSFLLDPSGVVGANANYLYKYYLTSSGDPGVYSQTNPYNGGPQNNLLTWIEGDLLAGMNVGTVGSDKTLTKSVTINGNVYVAGTKIGTFNSQDWWSLGSTLRTSSTESVYDYYFGFLQKEYDHYNRYAETIYPFTDAYGFAYSDRITDGRAAISWNATLTSPIDTVEITILPDAASALANPDAVPVVEYYNAALDHYFITWVPAEIAKLDAGTVLKGWTRTGRTFKTFPAAQAGTSAVCRYYIPPAAGNSHFFGRDPAECSATAAKFPGFLLEDPAFMQMYLPNQGACAANTSPIYRVYSNRADANHRYVTDVATRDQMVARGWLAEGDGADRVVMCAPQ